MKISGPPTVDDFVAAYLTQMRAPLRQRRTVIGPAGTFRPLEDGERVLLGPDGTRIRIAENISGGTQVEHGEHLHAVVRPKAATMKLAKR